MIYLDQSSYTMFHTEEECKKYICRSFTGDEYMMKSLLDSDRILSRVVELMSCIINDDGFEVRDAVVRLKDILTEWKQDEINYCYAEVEDDEEQDLHDEGYVWGD